MPVALHHENGLFILVSLPVSQTLPEDFLRQARNFPVSVAHVQSLSLTCLEDKSQWHAYPSVAQLASAECMLAIVLSVVGVADKRILQNDQYDHLRLD